MVFCNQCPLFTFKVVYSKILQVLYFLFLLIIFLTEYEMCIQDILELQWHLDCKSCHLRQVQNQILNTERVNRRIQDDIDFMKKYSPLLEKKLNLEEEAVKDVLLTYEKVNANKDSLRNFPLHRCIPFCRTAVFWKNQSLYKILYAKTVICVPILLHTGTQCRQNPGRITLLAFNKSLLDICGM